MLDPGRDAPGRDAVAAEAKKQIEAAGTLLHENVWGLRKLAYEIGRSNEADYRWFRFQAPTTLLEQLDHSLKIADGVLRFRIFKVDAETPVMAPPATAAPGPGASREAPEGEEAAPAAADVPEAGAPDADAEPAIEAPAAPAAVAEPSAEPEPAEPEPAPEDSGDEPVEPPTE
jgi:ribosomal protein S6